MEHLENYFQIEIFDKFPPETLFFLTIIVSFGIYVHWRRFSAVTGLHGPAIFTTAGICATFCGIALGLLDFDGSDVQGSLPSLLDGLKTAFWASLAGISIALTIKLRYTLCGISSSQNDGVVKGATIDDLVSQMSKIQQALVGSDDSTLLSQIKLTRQDSNDRLDALKLSQEKFMESMADNNSKALIQALEEVMRDFNAKINEQFGDNFKQLNKAVEKLLEWQDKYKKQMEDLIEQQTESTDNMTVANSRYDEILTKTERFSVVADRLGTIIETLDVQQNQIEQSLGSLAQLCTTASSSLPDIEKKILELTDQMTTGVRKSNEESSKAIRETSEALQGTVTDMNKMMVDMVQTANQDFNTHITTITNKTKEQVTVLDVALEQELTKSMTSLAKQLTALSEKFVEDYAPITANLHKLMLVNKGK